MFNMVTVFWMFFVFLFFWMASSILLVRLDISIGKLWRGWLITGILCGGISYQFPNLLPPPHTQVMMALPLLRNFSLSRFSLFLGFRSCVGGGKVHSSNVGHMWSGFSQVISISKYNGCNYKNFGVLIIITHSVCLFIHLKIFIEFY